MSNVFLKVPSYAFTRLKILDQICGIFISTPRPPTEQATFVSLRMQMIPINHCLHWAALSYFHGQTSHGLSLRWDPSLSILDGAFWETLHTLSARLQAP